MSENQKATQFHDGVVSAFAGHSNKEVSKFGFRELVPAIASHSRLEELKMEASTISIISEPKTSKTMVLMK